MLSIERMDDIVTVHVYLIFHIDLLFNKFNELSHLVAEKFVNVVPELFS